MPQRKHATLKLATCSLALASVLVWGQGAAAAVQMDGGPAEAAPPAAPSVDVAEPRLNASGRTMQIVAPVKDGLNYLGDVDVRITADDAILVSVDGLVQLLAQRLDTARLSELRATPAEQGYAPLSAFSSSGLGLAFDKRTLELNLAIATADRALQTIALSNPDPDAIGTFATPERFSAYVNVRGSMDYVHKGSDPGLGDPFLLFDGAARFANLLLESEGEWDGREKRFRRSGSRLVYDDAARLARATAGDLLPETRGFQGALDIAGLGVSRSYALLDPQRNVAPRGGRTFSLERDATVEAIVNGRTVRVLRLQPGVYNVSDFPFAQGGNDVELVITDDTGRRDVISFTTFIERSQLAAGLSEYSLNAGVLTDRSDGVSYSNDLALSGFYRRGLTDHLTVGANAQYANKGYLVGGEMVFGADWGTIGGDVAWSHLPGTGSGWAANFSLERVTQGADGGASLIATVEARSRRFGSPSQFGADNPYSLNVNLSYNRSLGGSSFAGAQLRYAKGRRGFVDERSVRLSAGHRIDRLTNVVFDAEWLKGIRGDEKSFRISIVRRFGARTSARAEFDSRSDSVRLGFQSSGGYGVGAWSGVANVDLGRDNYSLNASGNYIANRADIGLAHTAAYSPDSKSIVDQRSSLRFASSIAFAGGTFAVGRPISDSFAIMRRYKGSDGLTIEVEPSQGSYQARSGTFGPALYGQVGSYTPRTLTYDVPNATAGLDIGTGSVRMLSPYRAGYLVTVGSDYNVMVIGRLTLDGAPVELQVGNAIEVGGDGRKVELFTNRQGRFGVSGLRPGRWRIEMAGTPPLVYEIEVPDTETGIVRIGDLSPAEQR